MKGKRGMIMRGQEREELNERHRRVSRRKGSKWRKGKGRDEGREWKQEAVFKRHVTLCP